MTQRVPAGFLLRSSEVSASIRLVVKVLLFEASTKLVDVVSAVTDMVGERVGLVRHAGHYTIIRYRDENRPYRPTR